MPSFSDKQITTFSFLFIAFLMLVMPSAHASGSRYCKVDHYHSGSGEEARSQVLAKRSADRSWSSFTAWEYGQQWGKISIAMNKNYRCSHPTTGWKCTVSAKPCKITGRSASVKRSLKKSKKVRRRVRKHRRISKRHHSRKRYTRTRYTKKRMARKRSHTIRRKKIKKWSMKW